MQFGAIAAVIVCERPVFALCTALCVDHLGVAALPSARRVFPHLESREPVGVTKRTQSPQIPHPPQRKLVGLWALMERGCGAVRCCAVLHCTVPGGR